MITLFVRQECIVLHYSLLHCNGLLIQYGLIVTRVKKSKAEEEMGLTSSNSLTFETMKQKGVGGLFASLSKQTHSQIQTHSFRLRLVTKGYANGYERSPENVSRLCDAKARKVTSE